MDTSANQPPTVPEGYEQVEPAARPNLASLYAVAGAGAAGSFATSAASRVLPALRESPLGALVPTSWGRSHRLGAALELPRTAHVVEGLVAGAEWHEKFCRVVHARPRALSQDPGHESVFSGALHALAFPTAMSVLTRQDFPLPVLGMVHLSNEVYHRHEVAVGEELTATAWTENLRAHRAGTVVDAVVTLTREDGTLVWAGRSGYLAKGVHTAITGEPARPGAHAASSAPENHDDAAAPATESRPRFTAPQQTAQWQLSAGTGREYAAVSGDYNPIHLSAPTAKALGMKGAIAHGMYTASRALAATAVPAARAFTWSVDFAAPLVLPATVAVGVADDGLREHWRGSRVTVWDPRRSRPHVSLRVTPE